MLSVNQVSVSYHNRMVVKNACFDLQPAEIGCILGPSGCGKSTLLRVIAGFEKPAQGVIKWKDSELSNPRFAVNPEDRRIGMVFQDLALFPHLTIEQNIGFGLYRLEKQESNRRISELIELFELSGMEKRAPHELSGGEQQRVALARAMAPKPRLLLMDEAFSNLDVDLRQVLLPQVRSILKHEQMSAILVTHDQNEAFAIADKVAVMNQGIIHQWDEPYTIYHQPKTRFTAEFIGDGELLPAKLIEGNRLETIIGVFDVPDEHRLEPNTSFDVLIRPDDVLHNDASDLFGEVVDISFRGSHYQYRVRMVDGFCLYCFADSHHKHRLGERIGLEPHLEHLVIFDKDQSYVIERNITHSNGRLRNHRSHRHASSHPIE